LKKIEDDEDANFLIFEVEKGGKCVWEIRNRENTTSNSLN